MIGADGILGVKVDRVCAEAGLTKRYLYESFANLDEVLVACADKMFTDLYDRMTTATDSHDKGVQKARAAVGAVVSALAEDPRQARLYVECAAHPGMRERRDLAIDAFTQFMVTDVVRANPDSPGLPLRARIVVAGATDAITSVLASRVDATVDEVVDAVIAVAVDL